MSKYQLLYYVRQLYKTLQLFPISMKTKNLAIRNRIFYPLAEGEAILILQFKFIKLIHNFSSKTQAFIVVDIAFPIFFSYTKVRPIIPKFHASFLYESLTPNTEFS